MFQVPKNFFGESLEYGTLKIAEFFLIKSCGEFVIALFATLAMVSERTQLVPWTVMLFGAMLIALAELITNVYFYYGVKKNKVGPLKMWVAVYGVSTLMIALGGIIGIFLTALMHPVAGIICICAYILDLIFFLVMNSLCLVVHGRVGQLQGGQIYSSITPQTPPPRYVKEGDLMGIL